MTDKPQRIFIVEDEVMLAFEMSDTLEDLGFEVVGPSIHLEEAKTVAENEDIDVAILDVNLGGNKTSKPIADTLRERGIPFAFVTAYDRDQINFDTTNERVVKKPVSTAKLLSVLRSAFSERES
ncbi:response regulator [Ahrensia sp. R2A130]|uniref:response regulator n=1 Tax=Ahrensia sp. R2A130 TaxID=744979 RepID=UPI0001E0CA17|nr:response regulator [Ahrensia sp. R2A130]EFL88835.1 response regulator receiver domain-containing protein [Ahrensia sp. R2A130]